MRKILWSAGGILLLFIAVSLLLPSKVIIERDVTIDGHAATIFALLNDFTQVNKWSPLLQGDANAKIEFSGPRRGAGAGPG